MLFFTFLSSLRDDYLNLGLIVGVVGDVLHRRVVASDLNDVLRPEIRRRRRLVKLEDRCRRRDRRLRRPGLDRVTVDRPLGQGLAGVDVAVPPEQNRRPRYGWRRWGWRW